MLGTLDRFMDVSQPASSKGARRKRDIVKVGSKLVRHPSKPDAWAILKAKYNYTKEDAARARAAEQSRSSKRKEKKAKK